MKRNRWPKIAVSAVLVVLSVASIAQAQTVSMLPLSPYSQNFDTLVNTGTSSVLPNGWYLSETGGNTLYSAGTGSSTTGDTYSFGATSSTERALGTLATNALVPTIGVGFVNNTSGTIGQIAIAYTCEEWRFGQTGRGTFDRLDFQYSTDATSITTGTWNNVDVLDCVTADITGTAGARDGNTLRNTPSTTITGLSISTGGSFWIRWVDVNITNSDDGLGIDDFSLTLFAPNAVTLSDLSAASTTASPAPLILAGLGVAAAARLLRRQLTRASTQN